MLKKELIERLFDAASIERWNDHVRPVALTELDKQAHKAIIAYVLAKFEETNRTSTLKVDWLKLIEGGIFEFLQRVILTDIKPPVFHKMMAKKGKELNEWVLSQLNAVVAELHFDFANKFKEYLLNPEYAKFEKRILKSAHYLATNWEFKIIYTISPFIYGIEQTKQEIENQIEDHYDLIGVQKIMLGKKSFGFIDLCGQLRFQQRWAQSPRLPKTSVLGHMLIVAMLAYLCLIELNACPKRIVNSFYAGLFHDLPEVLTRDIISPVKRSIEGLSELLKEYETLQFEERLLPLLPETWHDEMRYYVDDEFANKIRIDEAIVKGKSTEEICKHYNEDKFDAIDGEIIKACDELAAYIEATLSLKHGIKSHHLEDAIKVLKEKYKGKRLASIDFEQVFSSWND